MQGWSGLIEQRLAALQLELDRLRSSETRLSTDLAVQARRGVESEELFRLLVESVRDYAIFMLDPQGHVATWNIGARRIKVAADGEVQKMALPLRFEVAPEPLLLIRPPGRAPERREVRP